MNNPEASRRWRGIMSKNGVNFDGKEAGEEWRDGTPVCRKNKVQVEGNA